MKSSHVLFQIFPFIMIGYLASLAGASIWPVLETPNAILTRALILFLAFLGLMGSKNSSNWNVFFLILFAFILGSFSTLDNRVENNRTWGIAILIAMIILAGCFLAGQRIGHGVGELNQGIWFLSWAYVLGWVGIDLLDLELLHQAVWASFGIAVFGGLITFWFAQLRFSMGGMKGSVLGIELYLLSVNVVVAIRILQLTHGSY